MPRQSRIDYPGLMHHVMGRGIERKAIFKEPKDKKEFLRRLSDLLAKTKSRCYAWCIMDNHYHLLLVAGNSGLSEFMRCLLTGYALYYNKTYHRSGHLFQNRYKSIVCDKDEYLLPLTRYIHLNPVRARIVDFSGLDNYPWTGYRQLVKGSKEYKIIEEDEILGYFGKIRKTAVESYIKFVSEGLNMKRDYSGGGLIRSLGGLKKLLNRRDKAKEAYDERILGCGSFVEEVLKEAGEKDIIGCRIKDVDNLLELISKYYSVDQEAILNTCAKTVREARSVLIYIGNKYLNKKVTEMGRLLGITQEAASIARSKGREIFLRDRLEEKLLI